MIATPRRALGALLATLVLALVPRAAQAQKALVYCPVGIDAIGCTNVANALRADATLFPGGVDLGYDGSDVTIDLRNADLSGYALFVVPSLADDSTAQPYALLRGAASRLKATFVGHAAAWSGTPDLGSLNRDKKDALIRNLAAWAKAAADGSHGPGVVALQDASDASTYGWMGQISALAVSGDSNVVTTYDNVQVATTTAQQILSNNGLQIGYGNMASGALVPNGGTVDATGGRGTSPVLVTAGGTAGGTGVATTVTTDQEDYLPGDTVLVTGGGWQPGETVALAFHEDPTVHGDRTLTTVADATGAITDHGLVLEQHDFGVRFVLEAVGQSSGRTAQTTFTDGKLNTTTALTFSPAPPITVGTSVTFTAHVEDESGAKLTVGTIAFYRDGSNPNCSGGGGATLMQSGVPFAGQSGNANFSTSGLTAGTHTILACYSGFGGGNDGFKASQASTTITINPVQTAAATSMAVGAASGTFGGTTTLTATLTSSSTGVSGKPVAFTLNGASVGTATTNASGVATLNNVSLSGINAGTYATGVGASFAGDASFLTSSGTGTLSIGKATATLTLDAATLNQAYTGSPRVVTATTSPAGLSGVAVTYAGSPSAPSAVGSYAVVASLTNQNYQATNATGTLVIGKASQTITFAPLGNKTFGDPDFTVSATTSSGLPVSFSVGATDQCTISGNTVHITGAGSCTVTASQPGDASFAAATPVSRTFAIAKATATVTLNAATLSQTYDGTARVVTATTSPAGLSVAITYDASATAPTNAGSYAIVATINDANYQGGTTGTLTVAKAHATLSLSGLNLTYNGSPQGATVTTSPSGLTGVGVTYNASATEPTDAGSYAVVATLTNLNYEADAAAGTLVIAKFQPTIELTAPTATYDKQPHGATGVVKGVGGATIAAASISYSGSGYGPTATAPTNAGTYTVDGSYAESTNYLSATAQTTLTINKATPTISWNNPAGITYGTLLSGTQLNASISGVGGEAVSGSFAYTPAAGTKLHAGSQTLSTTFTSTSGNYTDATKSVTIEVAQRPLVVTATADDKTYDGTTDVTVHLSDDRLSGDAVTLDYTAVFDNKNVGTDKVVTISGLALTGGANVGDYQLTTSTVTTKANITPATLTPVVTVANKQYDGTTAAVITDRSLLGIIGPDKVALTGGTAAFVDKHAGTGKTVNVTGLGLTGDDAGNYIASSTATAQADITPRPLAVTAHGVNKVYDGTTAAAVTFTDDRLPNDAFTIGYSAAFDTKNVGTGKTVTVTGMALANGAEAGDYALGTTTATTTADITPAQLTPVVQAANKQYDGTAAATITNRALTGIIGPDKVALVGGTATFADKKVGTGKTVTVTGLSLDGDDATNYVLTLTTAATTANITPRPLAVTAAAQNKVYDGNKTATVTLSDDRVSGDLLTLAHASASFPDKNVGTGRAVSVSGISVGGTDAGNYTFNTTASTTADITPRALTVSATAQNKVYDGTTAATVTLADDRVSGDVLSTSFTSAAFADKNVGTGKAVTVSGISVTGSDAPNYTFNTSATTTANITAKALTITANAATMIFGAPAPPAFSVTYDGFVTGETQAVLGGSLSFSGPAATANGSTPIGSYAIVPGGLTSTNYAITFVPGTMKIIYFAPAGGTQFLQPINPNLTTGNRSTFKIGSTIPTKFQLFLADGVTPATGQIASISVRKTASGTPGPIDEDIYSTVPDQGTQFRYDASGRQYIFNLGTKGWTEGTYLITATLADGSTIKAEVEGRTK